MTVRVLSIDGGGVRGVIPSGVIAALEASAGKPAAELFDLVAGTSTGGIIAVALTHPAKPLSGRDLIQFYRDHAPDIFRRTWSRALVSLFSLADEKYPVANLERILKDHFGQETWLADLPGNPGGGPELLVTAYDIHGRMPSMFKSWRARGHRWDCDAESENAGDKDFRLWQIARATSAAPTYFEPVRIHARSGRERDLIDGGVYANNPAMAAYVAARRIFPQDPDVLVVSLGTGEDRHPFPYSRVRHWGLIEWARPLFKILLGGLSDSVDYQLKELLGANYHRITKAFDGGAGQSTLQVIDDASKENLKNLEEFGQIVVHENAQEIARLARRLAALPRAKAGPVAVTSE
jgi:patatin-like phospholipase/acyl hydrolase